MWDGEGVNFAIYSEHAEKVELCLFDATGRRETFRVLLPEQTDMVWHLVHFPVSLYLGLQKVPGT
jgi:isoamylase